MPVPATMKAAVYVGRQTVQVDDVPTPQIGAGELLVRVEACGICHTDLKKIEYDLLPGPRIFGHETAGTVVAAGAGVTDFAPGDRVIAFHHIPCLDCFYCHRKLYAQCPVYKKVGITAGFEPAGGGFGQYIRIMDWIVDRGVEKIPLGVSFERASLVEPLNTCHKAIHTADPQPGDVVVVLGQGPIGLMFTLLARRAGARVVGTDTICRLVCNFRGNSGRRWRSIRGRMMWFAAREEIDRWPGRGPGHRCCISSRSGRAGGPMLPSWSENSVVFSDLRQGKN